MRAAQLMWSSCSLCPIAFSDCDSPPRLIEASLDWLSLNFMPQTSLSARGSIAWDAQVEQLDINRGRGIDFIIWTGDSARHDLDSGHPRTKSEIYELNRWTVGELEKRFPGVPLVPTIGNNDIVSEGNIRFHVRSGLTICFDPRRSSSSLTTSCLLAPTM